jgi:hypothetical protein
MIARGRRAAARPLPASPAIHSRCGAGKHRDPQACSTERYQDDVFLGPGSRAGVARIGRRDLDRAVGERPGVVPVNNPFRVANRKTTTSEFVRARSGLILYASASTSRIVARSPRAKNHFDQVACTEVIGPHQYSARAIPGPQSFRGRQARWLRLPALPRHFMSR